MVFMGFSLLVTSCTPIKVEAREEDEQTAIERALKEPMALQVQGGVKEGLALSFSTFELQIPGKEEKMSTLALNGASGMLQLESASLHGLGFGLNVPLDYNGVKRDFHFTLHHDAVYFSLDAEKDNKASYDLKFKSDLQSFDFGGVDEKTRGISYYEYGDLDYVLSEIFSVLEIDHLSFGQDSLLSKMVFDWNDIADSLDAIREFDANRFLWELPIGEERYEIGLCHDDDNVFSGIEFPLQRQEGDAIALTSGLKIRIKADIEETKDLSWDLPYAENEYIELVDSLSLFRRIANLAKRKTFNIGASFTLSHHEDAIEGDKDHFAKDAVDESCYINASAAVDLSANILGGLHVDAALGQSGGNEKEILIRTQESTKENDTDFFLNVNDILKIKASQNEASALFADLGDALGDESIQNASIMELLVSILSTLKGINDAITTIRESSFYQDIDEEHYEHILSAVNVIKAENNKISLQIDLANANMDGVAYVELNGEDIHSPLLSVQLDNVGVHGNNDSHTAFHLSGHLSLLDFDMPEFDGSAYAELTHLPHWSEEIKAIAKRDQLQARIEGYLLKLGTSSPANTNAWYGYGRSEQGFVFDGNIAFDLARKVGTGKMTFVDRKQDYVNDHTLKVDFTGEASPDDTDQNDMNGSGNQNAMYFEYNSQNDTSLSGYSSENRSEPTNKNGLKGRFSAHSNVGIFDVISELSNSTDVRFERLTNLVSSLSAETLLTKLLDGEYFELLTSHVLSKATISASKAEFEIAPGVVQPDHGLSLTIGYEDNGKPSTIEVSMILDGENESELYAKITLGDTTFDDSLFQFSDHNNANFNDYSSLKTLLEFALGTMTLGVTDLSSLTTYHLSGSIVATLLGIDLEVDVNVYIFLDGTNVKILAAIKVPYIVVATKAETVTNIFYETDGTNSAGTLYINRHTHTVGSPSVEHRKVKGEDFSENMVDWLTKYIFNFTSTVTNRFDEGTSSKGQAFHGEDIVESLSVKTASLSAPSWQFSIGLGALAHTSILGSLTGSISGKTVSYKDSNNKTYQKKSLYSLSGSTSLLAGFISAEVNFSIANISSNQYVDAWHNDNQAFVYYYKSKKVLFVTTYDLDKHTGTANALWNGSYGKTNSNSNYKDASWYTKP